MVQSGRSGVSAGGRRKRGRAAPEPRQVKYEWLKQHFAGLVRSGELAPGAALPPARRIALDFEVAVGTARRAMEDLERAGVIRRVHGKGTFVSSDARQRLARGGNIVALVVPETRYGFYPSLLHGVENEAALRQHQTLICNTDNNLLAQSDSVLQLIDRRVAGVVMVPVTTAPTPAYHVRQLHQHGIGIVFCHRRPEAIRAPLVTYSPLEVGRRAGRLFAGRGHRRVACFVSHRFKFVEAYEVGLREVMRASGGDLPDTFVHYGTYPGGPATQAWEDEVERELSAMLRASDPPTGVFCTWDLDAEMAYLILQRMGLRVGIDVSLCSFGGAVRETAIARRLTAVTVDELALGRKAAEILDEIGCGVRPLDDTEVVTLPVGVSEGETLGEAPARAWVLEASAPARV